MAVPSEKCTKCGAILHPRCIPTGRRTPPYSYAVGGCEWFNGEFICSDCIGKEMQTAAKRTDVSVSQYFKAMNSREKVF